MRALYAYNSVNGWQMIIYALLKRRSLSEDWQEFYEKFQSAVMKWAEFWKYVTHFFFFFRYKLMDIFRMIGFSPQRGKVSGLKMIFSWAKTQIIKIANHLALNHEKEIWFTLFIIKNIRILHLSSRKMFEKTQNYSWSNIVFFFWLKCMKKLPQICQLLCFTRG